MPNGVAVALPLELRPHPPLFLRQASRLQPPAMPLGIEARRGGRRRRWRGDDGTLFRVE